MALIRDGSRRAPCEPWGRSGRPRRARPRRSKVSSTIPAPASCTSRCEPRPRRQSDAAPRSPISAKARRPRSSRDRHRHGRSGSPVKPAPHRLLHRLLAARPASVRARYLAATRSEPSSARKAGSWTCRRTQPVGTERASPEPRKGLLWEGLGRYRREKLDARGFGHWRSSHAQNPPKKGEIGRFCGAFAGVFCGPHSAWQADLRAVGRSTGGSVDKLGVTGSSPVPPILRRLRSVAWLRHRPIHVRSTMDGPLPCQTRSSYA
jgi:hypothetical protein